MPTLGDYRIIREVGRGGMGIVYEAEQLSLRRRVALKVLPFASALDPRQLQRFHNEALAAASLHHEHIIPVFAVGSERGVHFYAMQFIDGCTLADVITELAASVQGSGFSVQKGQDTGTSSQDAAVLAASLPETEQATANPKSKIENPKLLAAATEAIAALSTVRTTNTRAFFRRAAELTARPPRPWSMRTASASCTATSSRETCWSIERASCSSATLVWPASAPMPA